MALVAPETRNAPLWDVLAHGRDAAHAHWFDVDWDALDGRIGLPGAVGAARRRARRRATCGSARRTASRCCATTTTSSRSPTAPGTATPRADVAAVLERQHYRLAGWRERDEVLNYRRFFDVDSLIAVRVEQPDVFEATHRVLLDLNHRGIVEGFRIDHPDGLADPEGYLERLRAALRPGTAIWVEKILEGDETAARTGPATAPPGTTPPRSSPTALVDPAVAPALQHAWEDTGGEPSLERRRSTRPSARSSPTCWSPSGAGWSAGPSRRCPTPTPRGSPRRSSSCSSPCEVYRAYVRPGDEPDDARPAADRGRARRPRAPPAPT